MNRRSSILDNIDLANGPFLEIGPLYRPLLVKGEVDVLYLDHCSTQDLREKYRDDAKVSDLPFVNVDIVVKTGARLADAIGLHGPFSAIVASHVIEHVPDLVSWLQDAFYALKPGGVLCLAVPDKRYTFDVLRRSTRLKDVDEAHEERRWRPSLDLVCDSYRNVSPVEGRDIWAGIDLDALQIGWASSIVNQRIRQHLKGEYVDVHCWVFSPLEFIKLISAVVRKYSIPFELRYFKPTAGGDEEFHLQLVARLEGHSGGAGWVGLAETISQNSGSVFRCN